MHEGQELTAELYKKELNYCDLSPNAVAYCQRDRKKKDKRAVRWNIWDRTEIHAAFWRGNPKEGRRLDDLYINHIIQDRNTCVLGSKKKSWNFFISWENPGFSRRVLIHVVHVMLLKQCKLMILNFDKSACNSCGIFGNVCWWFSLTRLRYE